jgi:hypothetical protein
MSAGRFRAPGRQGVRRHDHLAHVRDRDDGVRRARSESSRCPERDRIPAGGFEGGVHQKDTLDVNFREDDSRTRERTLDNI